MPKLALFLTFLVTLTLSTAQDDKHRPQIHFSIAANWINDPNGMVFLDGEYHLQYQYNPFDSVWGPMHWGHSVSTDLVTWTQLPTTLYPDELGQIFSGSAVVDMNNSTGFQMDDNVLPIVAIFTHAGGSQQQSIAYSLDKGRTYEKFEGNPVIPNPGIGDFRDPKVMQISQDKWLLVLAAGNKVMFYTSQDLKTWEYASEFGADPEQGSHSGVWECPDLFPLQFGGETVWVLIVSINPGGPNGGSATQYFIGDFDGTTFYSSQTQPLWMDWGVDNYAAVSFSNEPSGRIVMMGWMNNWDYANDVPTNGWRGQMTLPRVMALSLVNEQFRLTSNPVPELEKLFKSDPTELLPNEVVFGNQVFEIPTNEALLQAEFIFDMSNMSDESSIAICFSNALNQEVCTGYDKNQPAPIFLDRERSGDFSFNPGFSRRATATRELSSDTIQFEIFLDVSAIEIYIDGGLTSMTALFYPDEPFTRFQVRHHSNDDGTFLLISSGVIRGLRAMDEISGK